MKISSFFALSLFLQGGGLLFSSVTVLPELRVDSAIRGGGDPERSGFAFVSLERSDLETQPGRSVDDLLRQVPNFSLFRRNSSAVSNPTTQGASLRGIGPSGTSRTLVLYDGIPLNDAFGGWIPWAQVDPFSLDRIEVVRGGGSAAWGNTAIGGVISLLPAQAGSRGSEVSGYFGSQDLRSFSFRQGSRGERYGWEVSGRTLSDGGFVRIDPTQAGPIDIAATAESRLLEVRGEASPVDDWLLGARILYFDETRGNGTPLTVNSTENWLIHLKAARSPGEGSAAATGFLPGWQANGYWGQGDYTSTFSSVNQDRSSEQIVLDQFAVPSEFIGGMLQYAAELPFSLMGTAGLDFRHVKGETNEFVVFAGAVRRAGARQNLGGAFVLLESVQEHFGNFQVGGRLDLWQLRNAFLQQPNQPEQAFANRSQTVRNFRLGWDRSIVGGLTGRAAIYEAFRVPTINELVRPFQVGADLTQANPDLEPERLKGGEVGFDWLIRPGLLWKNTFYWNEVQNPILNLTIGQTAAGGQLRQRRNIERSEIKGWESDLAFRSDEGWFARLGAALTDARIREAERAADLVGRQLAQVPRFSATGSAGYQPPLRGPGFNLSARWLGKQFEDDLNTRLLGGGFLLDGDVYVKISENQRIWLSITNLLDRRLLDGITGADLRSLTAPRRGLIGFSAIF